MILTAVRRLYGTPEEGLRFGVPVVWVRARNLEPGDLCELACDEVLVLFPPGSGDSAQAERVRRALAEEG